MRVVELSESLSVSDQISLADVATIAAAGFKILINNRPDNEAQGQPGSDEISVAAETAGLAYYHLPVTAWDFSAFDFQQMAELISDSERPALAFCRSGTRCTNLWIATREPEQRDASVLHARQLGYDLSMALSQSGSRS
jgi:uncharacterized protein (TIGR01244 family)